MPIYIKPTKNTNIFLILFIVQIQVPYDNRMKLKFQAKSARVKGIAFHPSKPWVITALHSSLIQIWDYNIKICVGKFEGHDGPVRGIDFHPQLPLFTSGGDDGLVRVWDYKQKRCMFSLNGHIDYIRSTFFHNQLPWILSACDDQTMRIWNYQSRACVNIITGHSHYVMCAQFHNQKNLIVSASLDSTIRLWDFSVLKKKLTQSKNLSSFIGIQIECIKILNGHQRGCNWVCFHPTENLIASASDDRKIKLWKYTNQTAWEHQTIPAHRNNVTCVLFDQKSGNLISNSEDKTLKIWNCEIKANIQIQKRDGRYWMLRANKNGNLLAAGHDSGLQIWSLNKEIVPYGLLGSNILVYAHGMKTLLYDIEKKVQKEQPYQYVPKDKNALTFTSKIIVNQFASLVFMVQVDQKGEKNFIIRKKYSCLSFLSLITQYPALDSCFISKNQVAILASPNEIQVQTTERERVSKKQVLRLSDKLSILNLFSSNNECELILSTKDSILKYDIKNEKTIGKVDIEQGADIKQVILGKDKIAIYGKHILLITTLQLQIVVTIHQKFTIQSAFWEKDNLLFYTTKIHWKYALLNGETGVLKTLDQPLHLVKKLTDRKFLAFRQNKKIFELECPQYHDIEFKLAVQDKEWAKVDSLIKNNLGKKKKNLMGYLVGKGYALAAVQLAQNNEQKFALAIQATNFQLAFEICQMINTPEHWRLLGEEALKQGIYEAYQLASQKQKQYDKLNFLYSLQQNRPKLQKMMKLSIKLNNPPLALNSALFLNNLDEQQHILRDCGLDSLAQLAQEAQSGNMSQRLKSLGSQRLQPIQPEGELDFSNWPHNMQEQQEQS